MYVWMNWSCYAGQSLRFVLFCMCVWWKIVNMWKSFVQTNWPRLPSSVWKKFLLIILCTYIYIQPHKFQELPIWNTMICNYESCLMRAACQLRCRFDDSGMKKRLENSLIFNGSAYIFSYTDLNMMTIMKYFKMEVCTASLRTRILLIWICLRVVANHPWTCSYQQNSCSQMVNLVPLILYVFLLFVSYLWRCSHMEGTLKYSWSAWSIAKCGVRVGALCTA